MKGLDAIERAQRDTITTIQAQTNALLSPESRLLNLPSTFNTPQFNPGFGTTGRGASITNIRYGETRVTVQVNVESNADPAEIGRAVERKVGDLLSNQRRNGGWSRAAA